MNDTKIIYKDLSYKINGVLYAAHNDLAQHCNEQQVCDKIEFYLQSNNVQYEREKVLAPSFEGEKQRRNRVDFIIEDKIIIEVKVKNILTKDDFYQVMRYLEATNLKLGILVNFRRKYIYPKRILNPSAKI